MARNLKSFRRKGNDNQNSANTQADHCAHGIEKSMTEPDRARIENMVNEYGGKSEAELMDEVMRITEQQKRDGSFNPEAMRRTASSIMPMLTPEQQQKLAAIMNRLGG